MKKLFFLITLISTPFAFGSAEPSKPSTRIALENEIASYEEIESHFRRGAILKGATESSTHTYFMKTIVNLLLPSFQMALQDQNKRIEQLESELKQLKQKSAEAGAKIDEQESQKRKNWPHSFNH